MISSDLEVAFNLSRKLSVKVGADTPRTAYPGSKGYLRFNLPQAAAPPPLPHLPSPLPPVHAKAGPYPRFDDLSVLPSPEFTLDPSPAMAGEPEMPRLSHPGPLDLEDFQPPPGLSIQTTGETLAGADARTAAEAWPVDQTQATTEASTVVDAQAAAAADALSTAEALVATAVKSLADARAEALADDDALTTAEALAAADALTTAEAIAAAAALAAAGALVPAGAMAAMGFKADAEAMAAADALTTAEAMAATAALAAAGAQVTAGAIAAMGFKADAEAIATVVTVAGNGAQGAAESRAAEGTLPPSPPVAAESQAAEGISPPSPPVADPLVLKDWEQIIGWCLTSTIAEAGFVVDEDGFVIATAGKVPVDDFDRTGAELLAAMERLVQVDPTAGRLQSVDLIFGSRTLFGLRVSDELGEEFILGLVSATPLNNEAKNRVFQQIAVSLPNLS